MINCDGLIAGPETDLLVAKHVVKWPIVREGDPDPAQRPQIAVYRDSVSLYSKRSNEWSPSTKIEHAWEVVCRFTPYIKIDARGIDERNVQGWCCSIWLGGPEITAYGATAQLAICKAALKAVNA